MTRVPAIAVAALAAFAVLATPLSASATSYRAVAWGDNTYGQLGDGTETSSRLPLEVRAPKELTAIAGGSFQVQGHSLGLLASGVVLAWGGNEWGQLGGGSEINNNLPMEVKGLAEVTAIAAGDEFNLALLKDGTIRAWGRNDIGQLGNGLTGPETCEREPEHRRFPCSRTPVEVKGLKEVIAIAAGSEYGLALLKDGTVRAWGRNDGGQLGDGSATGPETCESGPEGQHFYDLCSRTPVEVKGLKEVAAIAAGAFDGVALLSDGTVRDWGYNGDGELGDGEEKFGSSSSTPVEVKGLKEVAGVAGGDEFSVALLKDRAVRSWGYGFDGDLGDGNERNSSVPVEVKGLRDATALAAGGSFGLALLKDGTVRSWGANGAGQLGNGRTKERAVPVKVKGLTHVTAVAAGGDYGLALTVPPPPTVMGVSPQMGPTTGGTVVTITGTDFAGLTRVMFGPNEAIIKSSTDTSAVVESPAGIGTVHVTLTTPYGTSPASGKGAKRAKFKYKRVK
jgi:alpha-tubulin suppressor-like RCC1 family protein